MKVAVTALTLLVTVELVLGVPPPGYGPPQPFPPPQKYRPQNGGPIPAKFPPFSGSHFGKNEYYSKFNPHLLPPGVRLPQSKLPPTFGKYPPPPSPGKYQQFQQQQQHQQQQQQQHQPPPHHLPNFKPIGPQFQSKPQLLANLPNQHSPQGPHQFGGQDQQRLQPQPQPLPQITNIRTGPKLSVGPPDFPTRFPSIPTTATAAASHVVPATQPPPLEKRRGPYIINSDDERGPIKTIPAPNLNPADKPANFDEQLYRAQHQQSFVQQLDNSITDEKSSYQVTEDPSAYKPLSGQPSYFAPDPDTVQGPKIQSPPIDVADSIPSVGKVPLDVALQQHLDAQHQHQQVPAAAAAAESGDKLTAQELYALLNGNGVASAVVPQTAYMVPQQVMYAVPQPQPLDLQIGQPLQYSPQSVQLQYAQPLTAAAAATGVDLQYLQPQTVQYQPQPVHYQPQTVQYQPQAVQYQQYLQQQPGQYVSQQQTAEDTPSYEQEQQQQQDQLQQLQEQSQQQQQQQQQQHQQQQQDQLQQQQQYTQQQQQQQQQYTQQQQQQQAVETSVQYQQEQELQDYEPRNNKATAAPEQQTLQQPDEESLQQDRGNFESIRNQYYSAVPNEQTAGVLAQIAESAAANRDAVAESSAAVVSATPAVDQPSYGKPSAEKSATGEQSAAVQMQTSVQIQQSVPLYEGSYASSRRHQEYADDGGVHDELMEGSESVAVSESAAVPSPSSVNGHAPSQFPYNAAKINAFAAN